MLNAESVERLKRSTPAWCSPPTISAAPSGARTPCSTLEHEEATPVCTPCSRGDDGWLNDALAESAPGSSSIRSSVSSGCNTPARGKSSSNFAEVRLRRSRWTSSLAHGRCVLSAARVLQAASARFYRSVSGAAGARIPADACRTGKFRPSDGRPTPKEPVVGRRPGQQLRMGRRSRPLRGARVPRPCVPCRHLHCRESSCAWHRSCRCSGCNRQTLWTQRTV